MTTDPPIPAHAASAIRARPAGFVHDVASIAGRALRAVPRDLEAVVPPVFIALFFFVVNIGTLRAAHRGSIAGLRLQGVPDGDGDPARRHRRVPGAGRSCSTCRTATSTGCCSRRCGGWPSCSATWSPTSPWPAALTVPIIIARASSSASASRPARSASSCSSLLAALWSLAFAGFGYAIALKTGNPAAVNSSFLLFFPFLFLTSSYVPREPAHRAGSTPWPRQPGHLPARRPALADHARAGSGTSSARRCSPSPSSAPSACRCASPPSAAASSGADRRRDHRPQRYRVAALAAAG